MDNFKNIKEKAAIKWQKVLPALGIPVINIILGDNNV